VVGRRTEVQRPAVEQQDVDVDAGPAGLHDPLPQPGEERLVEPLKVEPRLATPVRDRDRLLWTRTTPASPPSPTS
jgi:hypothetical protein